MFPSTRPKLYNKITVGKLKHIRNEGYFSLSMYSVLYQKYLEVEVPPTSRMFIFIEYL